MRSHILLIRPAHSRIGLALTMVVVFVFGVWLNAKADESLPSSTPDFPSIIRAHSDQLAKIESDKGASEPVRVGNRSRAPDGRCGQDIEGQPLVGQARKRTPGAGSDCRSTSVDGQSGRMAPRRHRQTGCGGSATLEW